MALVCAARVAREVSKIHVSTMAWDLLKLPPEGDRRGVHPMADQGPSDRRTG